MSISHACQERVVVEIDRECHNYVVENDAARQQKIESEGWRVIRFSNEDVLGDVEAVAIGIARPRVLVEPSPWVAPSLVPRIG